MSLTLNLDLGCFAESLSPFLLATGWAGTELGVDWSLTFGKGNGRVGGCDGAAGQCTGKGKCS